MPLVSSLHFLAFFCSGVHVLGAGVLGAGVLGWEVSGGVTLGFVVFVFAANISMVLRAGFGLIELSVHPAYLL